MDVIGACDVLHALERDLDFSLRRLLRFLDGGMQHHHAAPYQMTSADGAHFASFADSEWRGPQQQQATALHPQRKQPQAQQQPQPRHDHSQGAHGTISVAVGFVADGANGGDDVAVVR